MLCIGYYVLHTVYEQKEEHWKRICENSNVVYKQSSRFIDDFSTLLYIFQILNNEHALCLCSRIFFFKKLSLETYKKTLFITAYTYKCAQTITVQLNKFPSRYTSLQQVPESRKKTLPTFPEFLSCCLSNHCSSSKITSNTINCTF